MCKMPPGLLVTTGAPYVAYRDGGTSPTNKATVRTYTGTTWSVVGEAGFSAGQASFTSLALHPTTGAPFLAYRDGGNSNKATVMFLQKGENSSPTFDPPWLSLLQLPATRSPGGLHQFFLAGSGLAVSVQLSRRPSLHPSFLS